MNPAEMEYKSRGNLRAQIDVKALYAITGT